MNAFRDALRAAVRVWLFTTLGIWIPGLLGWINEVTQWARDEGATPFPDARGLAFLFVAAITAAFPAAITGIVRWLENASGKTLLPRAAGPQTVPASSPGERGAVSTRTLAWLGAIAFLVVLLILLL